MLLLPLDEKLGNGTGSPIAFNVRIRISMHFLNKSNVGKSVELARCSSQYIFDAAGSSDFMWPTYIGEAFATLMPLVEKAFMHLFE